MGSLSTHAWTLASGISMNNHLDNLSQMTISCYCAGTLLRCKPLTPCSAPTDAMGLRGRKLGSVLDRSSPSSSSSTLNQLVESYNVLFSAQVAPLEFCNRSSRCTVQGSV